MDVAAAPGHLLWRSSGRKLRWLDGLPGCYRTQLAPGVLLRHPYA